MNGMNFFDGEKKSNLVHYEGELGVFDYDPREFKIEEFYDGKKRLRYCGNGKSVDLPDGCVATRFMFFCCKLPKDFSLGEHFDTSNVTDMSGMFDNCRLPEGFSLGEHFDTSKVIYMYNMFAGCKLPEGFSLGEHFDTSKVTNMRGMFESCKLPEDFSLGEKFDTSNVTYMSDMFGGCSYGNSDIHDYFKTQSDIEIIKKLRKH